MAKKKKREPIKEARRYVDNAREILEERRKLDNEGAFHLNEATVHHGDAALARHLEVGHLGFRQGMFRGVEFDFGWVMGAMS